MQFLRTKLRIPPVPANLLPRPILFATLDRSLHPGHRLTLLSAPAGFGRTTLLASWAAGRGTMASSNDAPLIAWLSLDAQENDPERFLAYLIAAIEKARSGLGTEALAMLASPQLPPLETILTTLLNALDAASHKPLVLVLDDYQFITADAVHEIVSFILDHLPPAAHLMLATRADPPLALSRLRARGQVLEIRAGDLRLTVDEAASFLGRVMGMNLDAPDVAALASRTEGWIAGLQMAALSLRGQPDPNDAIRAFSGSNRFILDYLVEEVLSHQPAHVQDFLIRTSFLKRLCGPLCDAVLDIHADSGTAAAGGALAEKDGPSASQSQHILRYLENENLFLVSLDEERRWYRYHQLFADLLHARLLNEGPGLRKSLHHRAADWFERHELPAEAIEQALEAGDQERAARLVERNTIALLERGELHPLMRWVNMLPADLARSRPWLYLYQAWALAFGGRLAETEPLLREVENHRDAANDAAMMGNIAAIRAFSFFLAGDVARSLEEANRAMVGLPEGSLWTQSVLQWIFGYSSRLSGNLRRSAHAFSEVVRLGREIDNLWTTVTGLTDLGHVRKAQGLLHEAAETFREAFRLSDELGARNLGYMGRVEIGLSAILYEWGDLEAAHRHVMDGINKTQRWRNPNHLTYGYIVLARILLASGDPQAATEAFRQGEKAARSAPVLPLLNAMIKATRIQLHLQRGDLTAAWQSVAEDYAHRINGVTSASNTTSATDTTDATGNPGEPLAEDREMSLVSMARVLVGLEHAEEALRVLTVLERAARVCGRTNSLLEILVLRSLACRAGNDSDGALASLKEALALAEPAGYLRVFVDEGRPMAELLCALRRQIGQSDVPAFGINPDYIGKILAALAAPASGASASVLIEPLTDRELEVLHLLTGGLTNQEIAGRLFISPGTVKAHTAAIYRKLDVTNRTQAAARARALGLLPT